MSVFRKVIKLSLKFVQVLHDLQVRVVLCREELLSGISACAVLRIASFPMVCATALTQALHSSKLVSLLHDSGMAAKAFEMSEMDRLAAAMGTTVVKGGGCC